MNREETTQILIILASNYRFYSEQMSEQGKSDILVKTWQSCFNDMSYEVVANAVKKVMLTSQFPPTIAEIRKQAIEMINPSTQKTAIEAWNEAYSMICNGLYMTQEQFEIASAEVKKFFGNLRQVKELAQCDTDTVNTVIKGQFLKQYEVITKRKQEQKLLPQQIQDFTKQITEKINIKNYFIFLEIEIMKEKIMKKQRRIKEQIIQN